ncbi:MAG: OadG family protein [Candidatus Cloacimonetes bacterium]|nr:OadG family protein [Candidatus Cloacimonadota bacterium]
MKNIWILILLVSVTFIAAEELEYEFSLDKTLLEISAETNVPVKKIAEYLELNDIIDFRVTLRELNLKSEDVNKAIKLFNQNRKSLYSGIVLVGMSIVFASLILVGLIISTLQHVGVKKQPEKAKKNQLETAETDLGKVSAPKGELTQNGIVAAITAMMLHRAEMEENSRIQLTWSRPNSSGWRGVNAVENKFLENGRGQK